MRKCNVRVVAPDDMCFVCPMGHRLIHFRYWSISLISCIIIITYMIAQGINTMKMYEQKISLNYPFQEKDIIWNRAGIIE